MLCRQYLGTWLSTFLCFIILKHFYWCMCPFVCHVDSGDHGGQEEGIRSLWRWSDRKKNVIDILTVPVIYNYQTLCRVSFHWARLPLWVVNRADISIMSITDENIAWREGSDSFRPNSQLRRERRSGGDRDSYSEIQYVLGMWGPAQPPSAKP